MALMVSTKLLIYCLLAAAGYLLVISIVLEGLGRKLKLDAGVPESLVEPFGWSWFIMNFMMEGLFFVAIPTLAFAFFYFILPLTGVRAGMAAALFSFTLGAAPILMGLSVRIKLPMPFLLFLLLSSLVKVSGTLSIIAYLYSL
jgi:hypothetical protein